MGMCQVVCHPIIALARIQLPAANQLRDETMVSVGSKACTESKHGRKDILLLYYCKIIAKGEVVGMWFLTIASIVLLNAYWGMCY